MPVGKRGRSGRAQVKDQPPAHPGQDHGGAHDSEHQNHDVARDHGPVAGLPGLIGGHRLPYGVVAVEPTIAPDGQPQDRSEHRDEVHASTVGTVPSAPGDLRDGGVADA